MEFLHPSTRAIHADHLANDPLLTDVAPPIHVSTTFRYPGELENLHPLTDENVRPPPNPFISLIPSIWSYVSIKPDQSLR